MRTLLVLVILCSVTAHAQVYKCVNDEGHTEFSDKPCDDGAEEISIGTTNVSQTSEGAIKAAKDQIRNVERRWQRFGSESRTRKRSLQDKLREAKDENLQNEIARQIQDEDDKYFDEMRRYSRELSEAKRNLAQAQFNAI